MEEKKFPWLLRLLSGNEISIQMLDTYVVSKERTLAGFTMNQESKLVRIGVKSSSLESIHDLLSHLNSTRNSSSKRQMKHFFFFHKGKRTKISQKKLSDYCNKKLSLPCITYIQTSSEDFSKFLTFQVEYSRDSFKSTFIPAQSNPNILEKAKELCKYLIAIIETHERRKILKLQIEFMIDLCQRLWLSYMDFCQTVKEEDLNPKVLKTLISESKSSETLEIINEFDSFALQSRLSILNSAGFRDSIQRRPSVIRKLEGMENYKEFVRIDSPESNDEEETLNSPNTIDEMSPKISRKDEKFRISDDFIELLSRTKIITEDPKKKDFISDEDYEKEYNSLAKELRPVKPNFDFVRKKTQEFVVFKKSPSIRFTSGQMLESKLSLDLNQRAQYTSSGRKYKVFSPILSNRRELSLSPIYKSLQLSQRTPSYTASKNNLSKNPSLGSPWGSYKSSYKLT